jgi:hypothetical protein
VTGPDPSCRHGHTGWEQRVTTSDTRIIRAWSCPLPHWHRLRPLLVVDTDQPKPDTIGQASTDNLAAGDLTGEVNVAWQCYQQLRSICHAMTAEGRRSFPTRPIPQVARLGRTLKVWRTQVLAYFDTGGVSTAAPKPST